MLVNEIFHSIQGESTHAGRPCVFVRVTGCSLRCVWCDTTYAYHEGVDTPLDAVENRVLAYGCPLVEITGGDPLESAEVPELVRRLLDHGLEVLVETGGHIDITRVDPRSKIILDVKCPNSGMTEAMDWKNLDRLWPGCEVKFVVANRTDYEFARDLVREKGLDRFPVLFSPVHDDLDPRELAGWMLADRVAGRLQLQVHKFIWDPETRGV